MITHIEIDGFKSFNDFSMDFSPMTVIAGANAAGKSNLFDALRLLSDLANTDKIQKAFQLQRGESWELFTHYGDGTMAEKMKFVVEMLVAPIVKDAWGGEEALKYTRLKYELTLHRFKNDIGIWDIEVLDEKLDTIKHESDKWIKVLPKDTAKVWRPPVITGKRQIPYLYTSIGENSVIAPQDGKAGRKRVFPLKHATRTVLSSFDTVDFPHILAAKNEMMSWRFLQLNPEDLRQPTSKTHGGDEIDETGKNLAAALYRIKQKDSYSLTQISQKLHAFVPTFVSVDVEDDVENKQYVIVLHDTDGKEYTSRVLSEGTLRILALCILWQDDKYTGLLCFEEPENGVHPSRINTMAELLRDLTCDFSDEEAPLRQVIVNTHSTVFVRASKNYLLNNNFSMFFARMINRLLPINEKKYSIFTSLILPVPKDLDLRLSFSEPDSRLSIQMLEDFLEKESPDCAIL